MKLNLGDRVLIPERQWASLATMDKAADKLFERRLIWDSIWGGTTSTASLSGSFQSTMAANIEACGRVR